MTDDGFIAAVRERVALLQLRREAEAAARWHTVWAVEALFVGELDHARRQVRLALGAFAVWDEIPEPAAPPELDDDARARVYRLKRKRLGRFNYWDDEHINPEIEDLAAAAHDALSREYEAEFQRHPEAIYAFARQDARAFRAKWVVDQIERWNFERNAEALRQLMTAYTDARGKESLRDVANMAARDRDLYAEFRAELENGATKTAAIMAAAGTDDKDSAYGDARLVCGHYDEYRDRYIESHPTTNTAAFLAHVSELIEAMRKLTGQSGY